VRRFFGWFIVACITLLPIHALLFWLYQGEVRFRIGVSTFDMVGNPRDLELNTFTDEVGSDSIARSYDAARRRLDSLRGSRPRQTYSCEDEMTYPSISSVIQFQSGYAEVRVYSGNDSDGVILRRGTGTFPAQERGVKRPWAGSMSAILR